MWLPAQGIFDRSLRHPAHGGSRQRLPRPFFPVQDLKARACQQMGKLDNAGLAVLAGQTHDRARQAHDGLDNPIKPDPGADPQNPGTALQGSR